MQSKNNECVKSCCAIIGAAIIGLAIGTSGCGRSKDTSDTAVIPPAAAPAARPPAPVVSLPVAQTPPPAQALPEFVPPAENAPVVDEKYPNLASMALMRARLADDLPEGVLLQTPELAIAAKDLDAEISKAPPQMRADLSKNSFFLLEQMATQKLIAAEARKALGVAGGDEQRMLQEYLGKIADSASVDDAEVEAFYNENRDMMAGSSLDQMKERIRQHLLQEKQGEVVDRHIRETGRRVPVKVQAAWAAAQAEAARDNPVDKARASGKPTFANFGAKGCVPCDMMEPLREEIKQEYEGRLNVVFVHVNEDHMLASRYGVRGIPHLVFFDENGRQFHTHTGYMPKEQILEVFQKKGLLDADAPDAEEGAASGNEVESGG